EAEAQDALAQEGEAQDAEAQDALAQEADAQDAEAQDAEAHEASACAALAQEAALKTGVEPPVGSGPTKPSSAAFGFGGARTLTAARPCTSPTPREFPVAAVVRALTISAPLTWAGVHDGWAATTSAAAGETTGAASDG